MDEPALAAYLNDAQSRRAVREADRMAVTRRGTVRTAARDCQDRRSPDVLLVDLDGEQNPLPQVADLLKVCRPQTIVLATGPDNDVALANNLYRTGVFLYLPKPLDAASVEKAVVEVAANSEEERPSVQMSRVVTLHGKGMGVNTVNALLAHLAAEQGHYVTCLDLDPNFGSLAAALNVAPERGLAQLLEDPAGITDEVVKRLMTPVSSRISLLAYPMVEVSEETPNDMGLQSLIRALSHQAHFIFVCGQSMQQLDRMKNHLTDRVIVFEPTPAGVSIAARWLHVFQNAPSSLIMNHARPLPNLITKDQLRAAFGEQMPKVTIPYIRSMAKAMALGEPERAVLRRERQALQQFLQSLAVLTAS